MTGQSTINFRAAYVRLGAPRALIQYLGQSVPPECYFRRGGLVVRRGRVGGHRVVVEKDAQVFGVRPIEEPAEVGEERRVGLVMA